MRYALAVAGAVALLAACEGGSGDHADGGEVLEAAGICEGDIEESADDGIWRCPAGEPDAFYVLLEAGEDAELLTEMYLQDGAGGQLVAGDEPEPWLLDVQDPDIADDVAARTGGEVVHEGDGH